MTGVIATTANGSRVYRPGDTAITDKVEELLHLVEDAGRPNATIILSNPLHATAYRLVSNDADPLGLNTEPTPDTFPLNPEVPEAPFANPAVDAGAQGV